MSAVFFSIQNSNEKTDPLFIFVIQQNHNITIWLCNRLQVVSMGIIGNVQSIFNIDTHYYGLVNTGIAYYNCKY